MSPVLNILTYFASAFYNFQYMLEVRPPDKNACLHFSVFSQPKHFVVSTQRKNTLIEIVFH